MNVPRRRRFVKDRVYYGVQFEYGDAQRQPIVVSYRYTGSTDAEGRHVFDVCAAPPGAQMVLEKGGEAAVLDFKGLTKELNRHAS